MVIIISIYIYIAATKITFTDEERIEKLTKAATIAFERLEAIVG